MSIWTIAGFSISTQKAYLDIDVIHQFLSQEAYWSKGRPRDTVIKSIEHTALCFGVYEGDLNKEVCRQIGFARVVTDFVTFAYLCDVFIIPNFRNLGLSKWLIQTIVNHKELQNVRRFMLATEDAHSLYKQFGFEQLDRPGLFMQKVRKSND